MPRKIQKYILISFFVILQLAFASGATSIPTPTPTPSPTPTLIPSPTPYYTPTLIPFDQSQIWSKPIQLSQKGVSAWFPEITADSTGQIHAVWGGGMPGYDVVLYTSSLDGQEWKKINDIMAMEESGAATRPGLLVSSDGYLNMSFRDGKNIYFSRSTIQNGDLIKSWSTPVVMNGNQISYFSRMVEDRNRVLHYFLTQNVLTSNCSQCFHLFHRSSSDFGATWSNLQDISLETIGTVKPQVAIDRNNVIHVVWEAGPGGGQGQLNDPTSVKYANSIDGGTSWSIPETLSPETQAMAKHITIDVDINGNLIVVWLGLPENIVYYQTSNDSGKTWTHPASIPLIKGSWDLYVSRLDDYEMTPDSRGDLHLVLVGHLTTETDSLNVFHLIWNGRNWSKPDSVVNVKGDVPEWPRIAISNGNVLNVVWFIRDKENIFHSESGHYSVWYSRAVLSNVAAVETVIPTYLTAATPQPGNREVTRTPTNTPEPIRTMQPTDPTSSNNKYTEPDYLALLSMAILPSLLLIGLVILVINLRRR